MRHTNAIATRNVNASKTNTPAGEITTNRTPATTGPSMPTAVPKPASSALDEGNSVAGRRRAGHVESEGRLNVYMPADSVANT